MDEKLNVDAISSIEEYLSHADWRVKANANQGYSLGGMILNASGKLTANYWLHKVYTEEIGKAHIEGDYHIHDLDMLSGYCAGWSLRQLLNEGFNGIAGKPEAKPPKHLSTALGQMTNFLGSLQNEWAGAQAFSSFDTYLAPFVRMDGLDYERVYQLIQEFIYNLNVPSRWGSQCPFTNLTFDWVCPDDLKEQVPYVGGEEMDFTYGDLQEEMDMLKRAYIEVMTQGDSKGRVFTFPIPTYNITPDFPWESENASRLFEMTAKYGLPYFQNFLNSELKPNMVRSMCPLAGSTKVIVRNNGKVQRSRIEDVKGEVEVFLDGEWFKAKPVNVEKQRTVKVKLSSGDCITFGEHHLQPVYQGDSYDYRTVSAIDLKVGDYLPFSRKGYDTDIGYSGLGFAIGAYIGDGSRHDGEDGGITYTIGNKEGSEITEDFLKTFWNSIGYQINVKNEGNIKRIYVGGNSFQVLRRFITGTTARTKGLSNYAFALNYESRLAIISGLMMTDGSRDKRRIYTSSENMVNDLRDLAHSVGSKCLLSSVDNRTEKEGSLSDNPIYCLSLPERTSYAPFFKTINQHIAYRITEVTVGAESDNLYCFEVDNESHLFTLANGLITHNCRLQLDLRELLKRGNGLFGSAEQTGSIGVVTINCARLGYLYKGDEENLLKRLDYLTDLAKDSLERKRKVIQELMDSGLYPFTARYLGRLKNHFSTIGVNGINEMIRNFTDDKDDITTTFGHAMAVRLLNHLRERMRGYQEETGSLYNLEATPAEGTTYRFAREDKKRYSDIIQAGTKEAPYYTNSSQLPVGYTDDPFLALKMQDELQTKYTGGTVLHLYMAERISSPETCKRIVKTALSNFRLPYITITPTFSICPKHGYIAGEHEYCPHCDQDLIERFKRKRAV